MNYLRAKPSIYDDEYIFILWCSMLIKLAPRNLCFVVVLGQFRDKHPPENVFLQLYDPTRPRTIRNDQPSLLPLPSTTVTLNHSIWGCCNESFQFPPHALVSVAWTALITNEVVLNLVKLNFISISILLT